MHFSDEVDKDFETGAKDPARCVDDERTVWSGREKIPVVCKEVECACQVETWIL